MATATLPDVRPQQLRDPQAVLAYTQRVLDADFLTAPAGLRPEVSVTHRPAGPLYHVSVTGDEFGGPQDTTIDLLPEELDSPFAVRSAFRMGYSTVLRKVSEKLRTDRQSRTDEDEEDSDAEDDRG